jgi:serine/threonine-protein kinase RsbW
MNLSSDRIELILPFKAEFVSVARLTTSGIASRIGFDIDTIEDIKVSVAEVCNRIINAGADSGGNYTIAFEVADGRFVITFYSAESGLGNIFGDEEGELGVSIINAFMDQVDFCPNNTFILSMTKSTKGISRDGE